MQNEIVYQGTSYQVVNQSYFGYIFTFNDSSVAPAATALDSITIENDSFFLLQEITGFVTNQALDQQVGGPLLTLQIQDTGTGRNMFAKPTVWDNTVGVAQLPFIMPQPTLFKQLSTLQATIVNYNSADTYGRVQLALLGCKVFVR